MEEAEERNQPSRTRLTHFQLRMTQKGASITGQILQEMAQKIWDRLPQYSASERPKFSVGWLNNFKQRHSIRLRIRHGEATQLTDWLSEDLKQLRLIYDQYKSRDIYTMDEIGLFRRLRLIELLLLKHLLVANEQKVV
jgi:Tc5 transposase DNA-binding domain